VSKKEIAKNWTLNLKIETTKKKAICVTQLIFQRRFKIDLSWARESIAMKQ